MYLYTRDSVKKNNSVSGNGSWNREHVWPQSLSNNCWGESAAGADLLHIRPTYPSPNSSRGNHPFGDTNKAEVKTYNGMTYGYMAGGYFEPLDCVKGDVARIIMYVWTAYKSHYSNIPDITSTFESYDTLLKWHTMDKPDVLEGNRNDFSETSKQKNRNPFVDHPELAWEIFGDSASLETKNLCKAAYPKDGGSVTPPPSSSSSNPSPSSSSNPSSSSSSSSLPSSSTSSSSSSESSTSSSISSSSSEPSSASISTITSSEISSNPVISSEESSSNTPSSSSQPDNKKSSGCSGSIISVASIAAASALIGLVFVFSKKKE